MQFVQKAIKSILLPPDGNAILSIAGLPPSIQ